MVYFYTHPGKVIVHGREIAQPHERNTILIPVRTGGDCKTSVVQERRLGKRDLNIQYHRQPPALHRYDFEHRVLTRLNSDCDYEQSVISFCGMVMDMVIVVAGILPGSAPWLSTVGVPSTRALSGRCPPDSMLHGGTTGKSSVHQHRSDTHPCLFIQY